MQTVKIFQSGERKLRLPGKKKALTLFCPQGCKMPVLNFISGEYLDGAIIIVNNLAYVLVGGVWKKVSEIYTIQAGAWKQVSEIYILNGIWRKTT